MSGGQHRCPPLLLLLVILLVGLPQHALAASCCGGGSSAIGAVLSKYKTKMLAVGLAENISFGTRGDAGTALINSNWQLRETVLSLAGAVRITSDLQVAARLPVVVRQIRIGSDTATGAGPGDAGAELRYEILDDETCFARPLTALSWFDMKPSLHWVTSFGFPSGPSINEAGGVGEGATGSGAWVADSGLEITKVWGRLGNGLWVQGGYDTSAARSGFRHADWRLATGISLQWYFAYRRFVGLGVNHHRSIVAGSAPAGSAGTDAVFSLSMILPQEWRLQTAITAASLLQGRNSPMQVSLSVNVGRLP